MRVNMNTNNYNQNFGMIKVTPFDDGRTLKLLQKRLGTKMPEFLDFIDAHSGHGSRLIISSYGDRLAVHDESGLSFKFVSTARVDEGFFDKFLGGALGFLKRAVSKLEKNFDKNDEYLKSLALLEEKTL